MRGSREESICDDHHIKLYTAKTIEFLPEIF